MTRPSEAERALAALPSLGPASARMLIEVGVRDPEDLRARGAEAAYRALRFAHGARATATFLLYALDVAVRGVAWADLGAARMARLRARALQIQDELGPPQRGRRAKLATRPAKP
jgi:hypothetical protein